MYIWGSGKPQKSEAKRFRKSIHTQMSEETQLGSPGVFWTWPILSVTHDQRVGF